MLSYTSLCQDLPTEPSNGFSFPLGTKFTIKLHPIDSVNFDYSVIAFESFTDIVDTRKTLLFEEKVDVNGTIEFYFCVSTTGENDKEKKKNMQVLLVMKNRTEFNLQYNSDIQIEEDDDFISTSNIGTYSGAEGIELWPYFINQIALSEFRIR